MTTRIDVIPLPTARRAPTPWLRRAMVFLACAIAADSLFGDRGFAARIRAQHDYSQAVLELQEVRTQNAELRDQMRRLKTDPTTIEAVARQELGMIRPGEVMFVVGPVR